MNMYIYSFNESSIPFYYKGRKLKTFCKSLAVNFLAVLWTLTWARQHSAKTLIAKNFGFFSFRSLDHQTDQLFSLCPFKQQVIGVEKNKFSV